MTNRTNMSYKEYRNIMMLPVDHKILKYAYPSFIITLANIIMFPNGFTVTMLIIHLAVLGIGLGTEIGTYREYKNISPPTFELYRWISSQNIEQVGDTWRVVLDDEVFEVMF